MSKASYVESGAGSRLSASHALSQRDDVNRLEQTLGKGRMAIHRPGADKILGWEIPKKAVEALPPLSDTSGEGKS